jgi:cell fate (sporulation/competence/biofilm development) regulator YlbF (YheA/YmcA/DUF963 family)
LTPDAFKESLNDMALTAEDTTILEKTRELCQSIVEHPDYLSLRRNIDQFLSNDGAKQDYQSLVEKSEELNHKQHQGVKLSPEEITEFETHRERVVKNPVAAEFIRAQQEMHEMQETINKYLSKSFELGRVPAEGDMESGSCGTGCGCH